MPKESQTAPCVEKEVKEYWNCQEKYDCQYKSLCEVYWREYLYANLTRDDNKDN